MIEIEEDLAAIQARADAAMPGPWEAYNGNEYGHGGQHYGSVFLEDPIKCGNDDQDA